MGTITQPSMTPEIFARHTYRCHMNELQPAQAVLAAKGKQQIAVNSRVHTQSSSMMASGSHAVYYVFCEGRTLHHISGQHAYTI